MRKLITALARVGRMFDFGLPLAMVAAVVVRMPAAESFSLSRLRLTSGDSSQRLPMARRLSKGM
jgi:hypothetical protein